MLKHRGKTLIYYWVYTDFDKSVKVGLGPEEGHKGVSHLQ